MLTNIATNQHLAEEIKKIQEDNPGSPDCPVELALPIGIGLFSRFHIKQLLEHALSPQEKQRLLELAQASNREPEDKEKVIFLIRSLL